MNPEPTTTYTDDRGRWIVEHRRLRCPACGSLKPLAQSGPRDNGDGTATRPHICRDCGTKIDVVLT
jgi:DNA-directed RNA polymerase subunit RPC12/RpoP